MDELNLDAAAKTQVAALVQSLLDQVKKDAETLQAKDLKIHAYSGNLNTHSDPI